MDRPEVVEKTMERLTLDDEPDSDEKAMDRPVTDTQVLSPDQAIAAQLKKDYEAVTNFLAPRSATFETLMNVQNAVLELHPCSHNSITDPSSRSTRAPRQMHISRSKRNELHRQA